MSYDAEGSQMELFTCVLELMGLDPELASFQGGSEGLRWREINNRGAYDSPSRPQVANPCAKVTSLRGLHLSVVAMNGYSRAWMACGI